MLVTALGLGSCCCAAALLTLSRVTGWRWILKHPTLVDVGVTVGLTVIFAGTSVGMIVGIMGGLITAVTLSVLCAVSRRWDRLRKALAWKGWRRKPRAARAVIRAPRKPYTIEEWLGCAPLPKRLPAPVERPCGVVVIDDSMVLDVCAAPVVD